MALMIWNIRGLNSLKAQYELKEIIQRKINVFSLQETKINGGNAQAIRDSFSDEREAHNNGRLITGCTKSFSDSSCNECSLLDFNTKDAINTIASALGVLGPTGGTLYEYDMGACAVTVRNDGLCPDPADVNTCDSNPQWTGNHGGFQSTVQGCPSGEHNL